MTAKQTSGSIHITHRAIASIASHSALSSYGVIGLAAKNLAEGFTNKIVKDPMLGVDINLFDSSVNIDLYLIIEYGTRIKMVADNVAELVKYQIEKATNLSVGHVNVHVRGLRISNTD
ncbi:MAG TPA: Asp23/Gls24 family envelope stress response protein [Anaerolineaceae bacterium]|nr:Asp23/Gls24 family envelope stress response protein [Anaerolineaceae bacterium]